MQVGPKDKIIHWLSKIRREGEDLGIDAHKDGMDGSSLPPPRARVWVVLPLSSTSVGSVVVFLGIFLKVI
jgi:hypothetical protein